MIRSSGFDSDSRSRRRYQFGCATATKMNLRFSSYAEQAKRWPQSGRHILAQFDDETIIVYQAYRLSIGRFAVEHGRFGGDFKYTRMSWIKPNFLWMMYRSDWGAAKGQEVVLALHFDVRSSSRFWRRPSHRASAPPVSRTTTNGKPLFSSRMFGFNGTPITCPTANPALVVRFNSGYVTPRSKHSANTRSSRSST